MNNWQPIESAPKEEDLLLLYDEQEGVRVGFWDKVELNPAAWLAVETQRLTCGVINPTHWMLLPQPPAQPATD